MNEGRKRVDIVYDNHANSGFFAHITDRHQILCPKKFIECKNYVSEPKNPEIDQLLGRLGGLTGKLGILVCREVKDDETLLKRCKDAITQSKYYVIYLEDKDINTLLKMKENSNEEGIMDYFFNKWDRVIMNN